MNNTKIVIQSKKNNNKNDNRNVSNCTLLLETGSLKNLRVLVSNNLFFFSDNMADYDNLVQRELSLAAPKQI